MLTTNREWNIIRNGLMLYSEQNNISSLHCLFAEYSQIQNLPQDMLIRVGVQFQWFNKNYQFYEMTYLKRGQAAYLNIAFFKQLALTMPEQILLVLADNGEAYVGAALSFIGQDTLYGRYWGCYEEYHSLHFEACYYQGLEYCTEHNKQIFDSGAQGEHKISRGFEPINTYSAHWILNSEFKKLIADYLLREREMIMEYKQACVTQLPFRCPI